jgi:hypothetical protein
LISGRSVPVLPISVVQPAPKRTTVQMLMRGPWRGFFVTATLGLDCAEAGDICDCPNAPTSNPKSDCNFTAGSFRTALAA